jgi:ABC-type multidrug transport system fused ATPase/permease subunit
VIFFLSYLLSFFLSFIHSPSAGSLVLDEATSALDSQSEHLVQTALQSLFSAARGSLTVVVVAHRLSTVRGADAIAVLENGRVAEMGTYSELVKNNGAFSRLVRRQSLAGCEDEE